jgi:hypothetical protein
MTNMAETSLAAFRSLDPSLLQQKESEVLDVFVAASLAGVRLELTREQLAKALEWKEAAVCGRVNSLVKKGRLEEIDGGKTASGRSAMLVRLPVIA